MKCITINALLILLTSGYCYSQKEKWAQPEIGISGLVGAFGWYNGNKVHDFSDDEGNNNNYESDNGYLGFNLRLGVTFHRVNKSLNISLLYRFLNSRDGRSISFDRSHLYSNLVGLSGNLILFKNKKLHLITNVSVCTEFTTNYIDRYLLHKQYTPANIPDPNKYLSIGQYNLYKGTPLIGDIMVGCNFNISKNISLNLMAGYGIRLLKSQEAKVSVIDMSIVGQKLFKTIKVQAIDSPYLVAFHMLNFHFGLNYTFSFKKKPKTP